VGSGLVADFVANMQGFVAPFMVALVLLMVTLGFISGTWDRAASVLPRRATCSFLWSNSLPHDDCDGSC
jgi:hypothetical protein